MGGTSFDTPPLLMPAFGSPTSPEPSAPVSWSRFRPQGELWRLQHCRPWLSCELRSHWIDGRCEWRAHPHLHVLLQEGNFGVQLPLDPPRLAYGFGEQRQLASGLVLQTQGGVVRRTLVRALEGHQIAETECARLPRDVMWESLDPSIENPADLARLHRRYSNPGLKLLRIIHLSLLCFRNIDIRS